MNAETPEVLVPSGALTQRAVPLVGIRAKGDSMSPARRMIAHPRHALLLARGLLGALWFRWWLRLRGRRLHVGKHCRMHGRLRIEGPGEVTLGDNLLVIEATLIRTHDREARVVIGDDVTIGGTDIQCRQEIVIGDGSLLGPCVIMDSDFHSTRADRATMHAPVRTVPVHLGRNVWVSRNAGLLAGTKIGDNSVVAFGAVCMREFPANVIIMGNPAKVAAPIPSDESMARQGSP